MCSGNVYHIAYNGLNYSYIFEKILMNKLITSDELLTFIIETIDPVNASTFMIATKKKKIFRVLDLVS